MSKRISQQLRTVHGQELIDLSGKTDLLTLAALIGQARLLVTVDSAPMHFAAATAYAAGDPVRADEPVSLAATDSPALILQGKSSAPVTEFAPVRPRFR